MEIHKRSEGRAKAEEERDGIRVRSAQVNSQVSPSIYRVYIGNVVM